LGGEPLGLIAKGIGNVIHGSEISAFIDWPADLQPVARSQGNCGLVVDKLGAFAGRVIV